MGSTEQSATTEVTQPPGSSMHYAVTASRRVTQKTWPLAKDSHDILLQVASSEILLNIFKPIHPGDLSANV